MAHGLYKLLTFIGPPSPQIPKVRICYWNLIQWLNGTVLRLNSCFLQVVKKNAIWAWLRALQPWTMLKLCLALDHEHTGCPCGAYLHLTCSEIHITELVHHFIPSNHSNAFSKSATNRPCIKIEAYKLRSRLNTSVFSINFNVSSWKTNPLTRLSSLVCYWTTKLRGSSSALPRNLFPNGAHPL